MGTSLNGRPVHVKLLVFPRTFVTLLFLRSVSHTTEAPTEAAIACALRQRLLRIAYDHHLAVCLEQVAETTCLHTTWRSERCHDTRAFTHHRAPVRHSGTQRSLSARMGVVVGNVPEGVTDVQETRQSRTLHVEFSVVGR